MNTVHKPDFIEPRIADFRVTDEEIIAYLADGRTICVPLAWSWRLSEATPEQRENYEIIGDGLGIRWQEIDEDISVIGMFFGIPAVRPKKSTLRKKTVKNKEKHIRPTTVHDAFQSRTR